MKAILVATDGSDGADRAVRYAADRAKREGVGLVIANIIGGYGLPGGVFGSATGGHRSWLKQQLTTISASTLTAARDLARTAGVTTIRLESRSGDVAQSIMQIAQDIGVDQIVVGKRGAGRTSGLLLGSVSQKLVSLASLPVTVVP